jgi:hypothetical protein
MPRIPLYNQGQGSRVQLATGQLSSRANTGAFEAPGRAFAGLGEQVGDIAYQFGMAEKKKNTADKDAEISERLSREIKTIENDPAYTTASDARTAVDLLKTKTFGEIDALNMTPNQKRALRSSASKNFSIQGLNAEQKAYSRGLQESGKNMTALFDSKLDLLNSMDARDPRVAIIKADLNKYREEAEVNGFAQYLPDGYKTSQSTEDVIAKRQVANVISKENLTEADINNHAAILTEQFRSGQISESVFRSGTKTLEAKKKSLDLIAAASQSEVFQSFKNTANNIVYDDDATFTDLETAKEEAENKTGRFAGLDDADRPAIVSILKSGMVERASIEGAEVAQNLEFAALEVARTGIVSAEAKQNLDRLQKINPTAAAKSARVLKAASTANKFVGGLELASNETWAERTSDLVKQRDAAVDGGRKEDALVLNDALKTARDLQIERTEAIKKDPKKYYDLNARGRKDEQRGAGYVAWAKSVGLRNDEISVFTVDQQDGIKKRLEEASPLMKAAIYQEVKGEFPGVPSHLIVQSFRKAGMSVVDNILMVTAGNPVADDLAAAMAYNDTDLKAQIGNVDVEKNIAQHVMNEMSVFNKSITGASQQGPFINRAGVGAEGNIGGRESFVGEMNAAVLKLAKLYVVKGHDPADAARMAARVHTSQFVYSEINGQPIRVPAKYGQAEADKFAAGLSEVLKDLRAEQVQLQTGDTEVQQEIKTELVVSRIRKNGAWLTTADSQGVYLVDELGVPVKDRNDKRITVMFGNVAGATSAPAPPVGFGDTP